MIKSFIVDSTCNNMRLDRWLRNKLGKIPQGLIEKNLRLGKIKINKKKTKSSNKVQTNDKIDIFNFNFNTYNNCYNSMPNVSESESEKDEEFTAEIEISNNQEPVQESRQTTGIRTTTRSAVVPISLGSSTEDISNRIQEVVNTIINDTEGSEIHPVSAGISMTPILATSIPTNNTTNTGLSLTAINNNTTIFINNDTNQKCHICNEEYKDNDICRKNLKCGHFFHQSCIDTWYSENSKCPICDQEII